MAVDSGEPALSATATLRLIVEDRNDEKPRFERSVTTPPRLSRPTFYRAMLCIRGTSHGTVSVRLSIRLSVRLSVTSRCSTKTAKLRITQQHHTIPQGLLFSEVKDLREIRPRSPPTGAPNAGGVGQNRQLLTNNRLYLENGKR